MGGWEFFAKTAGYFLVQKISASNATFWFAIPANKFVRSIRTERLAIPTISSARDVIFDVMLSRIAGSGGQQQDSRSHPPPKVRSKFFLLKYSNNVVHLIIDTILGYFYRIRV